MAALYELCKRKLEFGGMAMIYNHLYLRTIGVAAFSFLLIFAAPAQENFTRPAYYRVVGVAANDVLNVRQSASSSAPIVASLAPNAFPVEIIRSQNGWGYVATNEGMGWVAMHFLQQIAFAKFAATNLPEGLSCSGTEPFWGLVMAGNKITYSALDQAERVYSLVESGQMQNSGGATSFVIGQNNGNPLTGIVSNQLCSDGMSDIDYGRRIDLIISGGGATSGFSGCCQISPQQ